MNVVFIKFHYLAAVLYNLFIELLTHILVNNSDLSKYYCDE